jgi:hypothetical protein
LCCCQQVAVKLALERRRLTKVGAAQRDKVKASKKKKKKKKKRKKTKKKTKKQDFR